MAILSDQLVGSLAGIMHAIDYSEKFPKNLGDILVKLIAKKDGTTRPNVLFRAIARIMGKATKNEVAKWEHKLQCGRPKNCRWYLEACMEKLPQVRK